MLENPTSMAQPNGLWVVLKQRSGMWLEKWSKIYGKLFGATIANCSA